MHVVINKLQGENPNPLAFFVKNYSQRFLTGMEFVLDDILKQSEVLLTDNGVKYEMWKQLWCNNYQSFLFKQFL